LALARVGVTRSASGRCPHTERRVSSGSGLPGNAGYGGYGAYGGYGGYGAYGGYGTRGITADITAVMAEVTKDRLASIASQKKIDSPGSLGNH